MTPKRSFFFRFPHQNSLHIYHFFPYALPDFNRTWKGSINISKISNFKIHTLNLSRGTWVFVSGQICVRKLVDEFLQLFVLKRLLIVSPFKTLSIDFKLVTLAAGPCCYVCCVSEEGMKYWYHHNRHLSGGFVVSFCYGHHWLWSDSAWLGQLYMKTNQGWAYRIPAIAVRESLNLSKQ
jgi:hypothetical protein